MRIKLHTLAPLPERKVLFPVNSAHTVAALAEQVCASVITPAISRGRPPRAHELVLEVDGFELLPNSSANVLEQNDVVTVRLKPGSSKRQAISPTRDGSAAKRLRHTRPESVPLPESSDNGEKDVDMPSASSDSSASASSSSSESSSEEESSSESESESESSSSSDSESDAPRPAPTRPPTHLTPLETHIPPFQGTTATHERNLRRRRARQMKKLAAAAEATGEPLDAAIASGSALLPLPFTLPPLPSLQTTTVPTTQQLPVPRQMENRNKKRGFLRDKGFQANGTKTVFAEGEGEGESDEVVSSGVNGASASPVPAPKEPTPEPQPQPQPQEDTSRSAPPTPIRVPEPTPHARLVPPSEKTNLPNNVFVTSRVFPFMTDNARRKKERQRAERKEERREERQQQQQQQQQEEEADYSQGLPYGDADEDERRVPAPRESRANGHANGNASAEASGSMWTDVDAAFDSLPKVSDTLAVGALVAWKEVVLDLTTFSPELQLIIAKVESMADGNVTLQRLARPKEQWDEEEWAEDGMELEEDEPVVSTSTVTLLAEGDRRVVPSSYM